MLTPTNLKINAASRMFSCTGACMQILELIDVGVQYVYI